MTQDATLTAPSGLADADVAAAGAALDAAERALAQHRAAEPAPPLPPGPPPLVPVLGPPPAAQPQRRRHGLRRR